MAILFNLSGQRITDANGLPVHGAKLYFYDAGTLDPRTMYTASDAGTLRMTIIFRRNTLSLSLILHNKLPTKLTGEIQLNNRAFGRAIAFQFKPIV